MNNKSLINYYALLNVKSTASFDEINKKYKEKALKFHPDKNKNIDANFKMQQLNEAKRILSNEKLRTEYNESLFTFALQNGDNKVINFFINGKGAHFKVNKKNNDGKTPLHYACIFGFLEVVELLIKNGANINAKNNNGNTPLHYAVKYNADIKLIYLLIKNGANINLKNVKCLNSLDIARDITKNEKIYNLLFKTLQKQITKENEQILLNMSKRINSIEKNINDIEKDITDFEQKKINSFLNIVIKIFSFGCINSNKKINEEILIKNNELKNLLEQKAIISHQKQLFQEKITKLKFSKIKKINAIDLQNQPSTSRYKTLNLSGI